MNSSGNPAKSVKRSLVACHRCHSHKIKCSGGNPCKSCEAVDNSRNCHYPPRERKTTIYESYLKKLEADSERLKTYEQLSAPGQPEPPAGAFVDAQSSVASPLGEPSDPGVSNPLFDVISSVRPDLHSAEPAFLGEAACSAFGERLLQCVDKNYIPPTNSSLSYFKHQTFNRTLSNEYELPDRIQAKLLIQIASKFVGNDQHLYLRKSFMEELDAVYQEEAQPSMPWLCKLFGLLALGEFYSHRKRSADNYGVPGTAYYLRAVSLLQDNYEDATITQVETLVLLSCFANGLGRVKAAYTYTGIAMRLSLILGLNRRVLAKSTVSPVERENRRRIWWTLYHFDRVSASKLGYPITIRDEDIDVEMPSMNGLSASEMEEFADPSHLVAKVKLASIAGSVLSEIYCLPGKANGTFVQRVHGILKQLRGWDHELPEDICVYSDRAPRHVASLHLAYNQLIITTTRPILLHTFKTQFHLGSKVTTPRNQEFSSTTLALAEACVNAARTSNSILTRLFIDGNIATFGYLDAHHLFSSTLILIMSAVMSPSVATSEAVQTSTNVLKEMRDYGNIPAGDYCEHLKHIQSSVSSMRAEAAKQESPHYAAASSQNVLPVISQNTDNLPRAPAADHARLPNMFSGLSTPPQQLPYTIFEGSNGITDALANPLIDEFLGGNWLAWPSENFAEDDPLRTVALELEDRRLFDA